MRTMKGMKGMKITPPTSFGAASKALEPPEA